MDLLCFCSVLCLLCFVRVCLYVLRGHLLGKGWPLGSRLWCLLWVCHFPIGILGQVWYLIVSIPDLCNLTYFYNSETPIICYKYNKPIRSSIFNLNKIVNDIDSNTPSSWDCQNSNYLYPSAGHVIIGNLNVIPDARVRNFISKGPKYRFFSNIDFSICRREIAASLNDFSNRWCKRENVEPDALKEWNIFYI